MIKKTPEAKAQAIAELWFRGILTWKLHKAQRVIDKLFKAIKGQLFVGNISRQWGKSFWAACKAIEMALSKPKAQIKYGAAFQVDLVKYIIPTFNKILEDCPKAIKGEHIGSAYVFPNGSVIDLVGIDKHPDSMRGNSLDLIIIDEAAFVTKLDYLYKSVIIPATTHRPNAKIIFISSAPSTPAHAFKDYAKKAQEEGSYALFTIYDNPLIDQETIDRLMFEAGGKESTTWRREFLCEFVTDSDMAIIPEWNDKYIQDIPHDDLYGFYHKYVGMDLGFKDFTALIFGYYDFRKATLIIEDEMHMNGPNMNSLLIVNGIKIKENEMWGSSRPYRRVSDNNDLTLLADFSSIHDLYFIPTTKESLVAMINELRLMVQSGRIIIHPRCTQTIGCLKYGIWDTKKKQFARLKDYGHFDHLAALIYLVRNLDVHTNPIPPTLGHYAHNSWLHNVDQRTNEQKFADILVPKDIFKPKH